jgi:hypothetical protein
MNISRITAMMCPTLFMARAGETYQLSSPNRQPECLIAHMNQAITCLGELSRGARREALQDDIGHGAHRLIHRLGDRCVAVTMP